MDEGGREVKKMERKKVRKLFEKHGWSEKTLSKRRRKNSVKNAGRKGA